VARRSESLVEIRGLRCMRGPRVVLDGVDMDFRRGRVTAIMGPTGAGKTTLLDLVSGRLRPHAGSVRVDGQDLAQLSRGRLIDLRKRIGMLFQNGALLTDLSVFENVAFPLREHTRLPQRMIRDLVLIKLEAVGLRGAQDLMPPQLSGGMARRAALARAIALDPMMVLYDEPFSGQDPISMATLMRLIRSLNDALHLTSVLVSHDVQETAAIADYLYILANGKVIGRGPPKEVRLSPSPAVAQFLDGLPDGPVPFHYPAPTLEQELFEPQGRA
jgi:phospholipid/cholesterol/gamma-HCH transport system ATP-binding protein